MNRSPGCVLPGVLCNIAYPSETHLKREFCEISFVRNTRFNCPIGLKFCTEHASDTAVLCAKFQSDRSTEAWVMGKRDFARYEFKLNFGRISYISQGPWPHGSSLRGDWYWEQTILTVFKNITVNQVLFFFFLHKTTVYTQKTSVKGLYRINSISWENCTWLLSSTIIKHIKNMKFFYEHKCRI